MSNCVFFSFSETDRIEILLIKGRAVNPQYSALNFRVQDLIVRWDTSDPAVIRQAITKSMDGTSRTVVFVGSDTYSSYWVPEEVRMTLESRKPVYAIRVPNVFGPTPTWLTTNGITLNSWSESTLQRLATQ
jgi:hypothetical protein